MSHPVSVLQTTEKVGRIVDILKSESHNGFPVVQDYTPHSHKVCLTLEFCEKNHCLLSVKWCVVRKNVLKMDSTIKPLSHTHELDL